MRARLAQHHQAFGGNACRCEQRQQLGLGIIGIELRRLAAGPAARGLFARQHYACRQTLAVRQIAPPDFEQSHRRSTTIDIALRRRQKAGKQRGTHHLHIL